MGRRRTKAECDPNFPIPQQREATYASDQKISPRHCLLNAVPILQVHLRTGDAKRLIIDSDGHAHGSATRECCTGWTTNERRTSHFYISGPTGAIERVYIKERIWS